LHGLNQLLHTKIPEATLAAWGSTLGADVPSFFSAGRVFCEGIGEKLTPVTHREESYYLIKPRDLFLSTPEVFAQYNCKTTAHKCKARLLDSFARGDGDYINDLERPAFEMLPALKIFKQRCIDLGFKHVVMTGSGTAFVCVGGDVHPPFMSGVEVMQVKSLCRSPMQWYIA
jgi:4-diphosphocytidyl-2-C-methyl-D-erythritol kinase